MPTYKPEVSIRDGKAVLNTDQQAEQMAQQQPVWERYAKRALAVMVIGCGAALPLLSPEADAVAFKLCSWMLAVGAGLGITSRGNLPR
jgi:hypothetical protein